MAKRNERAARHEGVAMSGTVERKSTERHLQPRDPVPIIAVDTGGTFTDFLLLKEGTLTALKLPSTPRDPSASVLEGIRRFLGPRETRSPFLLIHGSTVATNAVLERTGSRVMLVTNRGFEDVVEIGRQNRPQLYALVGHRAPPLVTREDRIGLQGRLGPDGEEIVCLDAEELRELPRRLADAEAVAVCLLHSYADPGHEEAVARALAGLEVPVALSSRILPEFREYERTSSTVVNAYVAPKMARYLRRLEKESGATAIRIMGSAGGTLPLHLALEEPVRTILSGPAGGVTGALIRGSRSQRPNLLTLDMGGTSTDVSLVPGHLLHTREGRIAGLPVAIPLVDIHTVGAGGGSIARVDPGGALRVGPASAGASPGPVCYGQEGRKVTVTDAHVWLGRLPTTAFLGGTQTLDREAIREPLRNLADQLNSTPDRTAEGIIEVANATMERALRVISVERGVDPSDVYLMAFGGAAGLHAAELAERIGARGVLIPPDPGLASAWGMLAAPAIRDRTRTVLLRSDIPEHVSRLGQIMDGMEAEAREGLELEGFSSASLQALREVDARYLGQSWELIVPEEMWVESFHQAHEERYGYRRQAQPVEAVTLRVRVEAPGIDAPGESGGRRLGLERGGQRGGTRNTGRDGHRAGRPMEARITSRASLPLDTWMEGPAVLAEYSSTTWCPPGWRLRRTAEGMVELEASPDGPVADRGGQVNPGDPTR